MGSTIAPTRTANPNARAVAWTMLHAVLDRGRALDDSLASSQPFANLEIRDRAFCRLLVATTLRRLGQIDRLVDACLDRALPTQAAGVQNALRLGAAQIVFLGTQTHAAVNETVALLGGRRQTRYRGLANAVLRRFAREADQHRKSGDAARINTPNWLWRSWAAAYGETTAREISEAHLIEPQMDISVKEDPEGWAARLDATVMPTGTLRRATSPVPSLPGFADGAWWVQDMAAALASQVLLAGLNRVSSELRIADVCAAPGGKTAQLAAAGAQVTALDVSAHRLERVAQNLARLGLGAKIVEADLRTWTSAKPFDAVLLDAPCSGTGTIRRHPDIARNKRPADVERMVELQGALLAAAARHVRPAGRLIYSVCSLQPEECEAGIEDFLSREHSFRRVTIEPAEIAGMDPFVTPAGDIRTLPCQLAELGGLDGFYICRLERAT